MKVVFIHNVCNDSAKHEGLSILHRVFPGLCQLPVQQPVHQVTTREH